MNIKESLYLITDKIITFDYFFFNNINHVKNNQYIDVNILNNIQLDITTYNLNNIIKKIKINKINSESNFFITVLKNKYCIILEILNNLIKLFDLDGKLIYSKIINYKVQIFVKEDLNNIILIDICDNIIMNIIVDIHLKILQIDDLIILDNFRFAIDSKYEKFDELTSKSFINLIYSDILNYSIASKNFYIGNILFNIEKIFISDSRISFKITNMETNKFFSSIKIFKTSELYILSSNNFNFFLVFILYENNSYKFLNYKSYNNFNIINKLPIYFISGNNMTLKFFNNENIELISLIPSYFNCADPIINVFDGNNAGVVPNVLDYDKNKVLSSDGTWVESSSSSPSYYDPRFLFINPQNNQYIIYDASSNKFINADVNLNLGYF